VVGQEQRAGKSQSCVWWARRPTTNHIIGKSRENDVRFSSFLSLTFCFVWTMMLRFLLTTLALVASITATYAFCPAPAFHSSREVAGTMATTALQVLIDTSEIKTGMTVELDGEPFQILSFSIMKQARGAAKTTIKFRNLFRGTTIETTFRSGEKFASTAEITRLDHQFTYSDEVSLYILAGLFFPMEEKEARQMGISVYAFLILFVSFLLVLSFAFITLHHYLLLLLLRLSRVVKLASNHALEQLLFHELGNL
jgi:hypothetical protein